MNILTKICVVLLLVASLIASVVFISMATVGPNWRDKYDTLAKDHNTLKGNYHESIRINSDVSKKVTDLQKAALENGERAKTEIDKLNLHISELKKEKDSLQAQLQDTNLQLAGINKNTEANTKLVQSLRAELETARKVQNEKAAQVAQLNEQLNDERARAERVSNNLREALTNVEDLKRTVTDLNGKLAAVEKLTGKKTDQLTQDLGPATRVTGTVTDVSDNLAQVNVGLAHGLKAGMKLIVYRGSKFVGWLKLEQVSADEAAGVMVEKQCEPMRGDQVTSSLE